MITTELIPIRELLERIDKKLDGKFSHKYLNINEVAKMSSLHLSSVRRAIVRGELKCIKKRGKLIFKESTIIVQLIDNNIF